MIRKILLSFILLLSILSACRQSEGPPNQLRTWMNNNGKLKVLSTIAMLDDLVRSVGGEYVDSITLIKGELNPHSYQLVKGDDEKLAYADLVFFNGLGLEHGPSLHHFLISNRKAIGLGNQILKDHPELIIYMEGQLDPHIWMDVSLWARNIDYIVQALSEADPAHAGDFKENGKKYKQELLTTHETIRKELQEIPEQYRFLVTSHDAFNYFTKAYLATDSEWPDSWRHRFAAPEGLAPESQLSARHIQLILEFLTKHQVFVLFPESNVSKDSIRKIVNAGKGKGINLQIATEELYADAMGSPGSDGDTYQKMIQHNVHVIAKHLRNNHP